MATVQEEDGVQESECQTKPPFLRRVRIRGYKSIAFCDVELNPLTILVGRNASGKSNFLDALAFLRDSLEVGPAEAVKRRGGWQSIHCRSAAENSIAIEVETLFQAGLPQERVDGGVATLTVLGLTDHYFPP